MTKYLKPFITEVENKNLTMIKTYSTRATRSFLHKHLQNSSACIRLIVILLKMTLSEDFTFRSKQIIVHRICCHFLQDGRRFSDQRYFPFVAKGESDDVVCCAPFAPEQILRCEHFKFFR